MVDKLYICDGLACRGSRANCYTRGGKCVHTSDKNHSIKKRLGNEFPPTYFISHNDVEIEQIKIKDSMKGLHDGEIK